MKSYDQSLIGTAKSAKTELEPVNGIKSINRRIPVTVLTRILDQRPAMQIPIESKLLKTSLKKAAFCVLLILDLLYTVAGIGFTVLVHKTID